MKQMYTKIKCTNIVKKRKILIVYVVSYYDKLDDAIISIDDIHN
jgi:hypothetical protein